MFDFDGYRTIMLPAVLLKPETTRSTLYAWIFLYLHRNRKTRECFPSVGRVAELIGVDQRTARKAITELVDLGLVERKTRVGSSTLYRLNVERKKRVDPGRQDPPPPDPEILPPGSEDPNPRISRSYPPDLQIPHNKSIPNKSKPNESIPKIPTFTPDDLVELYNSTVAKAGGRKCLKVVKGSKRAKAIRARLKEHPKREEWIEAFEIAVQSPGLLGENDRGWKTSIDHVTRPGVLVEILEGKYADWTSPRTNLSKSFREQDRLSGVMDTMRRRTREHFKEWRNRGKSELGEWFERWREKVRVELRAEDADELEGRLVEFGRAYWEQLTANNGDENGSGTSNLPNVENVQPERRRPHGGELLADISKLF